MVGGSAAVVAPITVVLWDPWCEIALSFAERWSVSARPRWPAQAAASSVRQAAGGWAVLIT